MFTAASAAAIRKKGAVRTNSRRMNGENLIFFEPSVAAAHGRSHHATANNTTGKITAEPLLSMAKTNAARLNQYHKLKDEG